MNSEYFIGVDLGTTNLKVVAFSRRKGNAVAQVRTRLTVSTDADGKREQPVSDIREALQHSFLDLRRQMGAEWAGVAGIGLSAQGGSGAIFDEKSGQALTDMMLWNDTRPLHLLAEIQNQKEDSFWRDLSWRESPGAGLARMLWYRHLNPDYLRSGQVYAGAGEYAYFLMTHLWRQDACNALQMGCYNAADDRLDAEPLDAVDVSLECVAPLRHGHEAHPVSAEGAKMLGVKAGIPVVGPYIDHEAGYMTAALVSERPLQCSLGTAWVGSFVLGGDLRDNSPSQLVIPSPAEPGKLVIQPLLCGNTAWDWGLENLLDGEFSERFSLQKEIFNAALLPPEGLLAIPWFTQLNAIDESCAGAGAFYGLGTHASKEDLLRALALGMACEFLRMFEDLKEKHAIDSLVLWGGAGKAPVFQKLFAALFEPLPVYILADEDLSGARGAISALDPASVARAVETVTVPVNEHGQSLQKRFRAYKELYERLHGSICAGRPYRVNRK